MREGWLSWLSLLRAAVLLLLGCVAVAYRLGRRWYYVRGDSARGHQPTLFFGHRFYDDENQRFEVGPTGRIHRDVSLNLGSAEGLKLESLDITRLSAPGRPLRLQLHLVFPEGATIPGALAGLAGIAPLGGVGTVPAPQPAPKHIRPECRFNISEDSPEFVDEGRNYRFLVRSKPRLESA